MATIRMKSGRNDLCPCGSGKKFKKCCLAKEIQAPASKSSRFPERRFWPVLISYYTQAAIAEALKPGGTVHIHPYVLIKMRDDPRLLETVPPKVQARILAMWRGSKLVAMTTEEIETRLSLIGVRFDRAEFIELAKVRNSAWDISKQWGSRLVALDPMDEDFLGLAACELWRRLCPERPSLEMLDDWLCEGYSFVPETRRTEALEVWWKLWQELRSRLTPEIKTLEEANERLFPRMSQCLSNWIQDFSLEAINGSLKDVRCGEIGIRFLRELLEALPGGIDKLPRLGDLGMIYFNLGRDAEAEQCCRQLIADHPDSATGYVTFADGLLRPSYKGPVNPAKVQQAIQLLDQALAYPVTDAKDFDVPSRLTDARKLLSRSS